MGETSGKAISPVEIKNTLGRGVLRPKNHQGKRADPTAFEALKRAARGAPENPPTELEMELLFKANPTSVRTYRGAGFTDQQIYDLLNH